MVIDDVFIFLGAYVVAGVVVLLVSFFVMCIINGFPCDDDRYVDILWNYIVTLGVAFLIQTGIIAWFIIGYF